MKTSISVRRKPLYVGGPTAKQVLVEAERQRRVPGIVFANGPAGRRARLAGTGIEVFQIVKSYRAVGEDRGKLARTYHWLSRAQLDAALNYAAAFPKEIEARLLQEHELENRYCGGSSTT